MTQTLDASPPDSTAAGAVAPSAPLVAALRSVLGKIEQAAGETDAVEMVHEARKGLKEYRALLRLVPGADARAARRHAAEVARAFAQARDRATAQEALDILEGAKLVLPCDLNVARTAVGADAAADGASEPPRERLTAFLADARARLDGGLESEVAAADLVEGLCRNYRAARRGRFGDAVAMHETRKGVVVHRYQMSFVASAFNGRGAKRAGRAQRLRDVLGAHHDIEILRPMLHDAAASVGEGTLGRLERAMTLLQKRLRRQARRLHDTLFRASPQHFAHKLRRHLAHDRSPPAPPPAAA